MCSAVIDAAVGGTTVAVGGPVPEALDPAVELGYRWFGWRSQRSWGWGYRWSSIRLVTARIGLALTVRSVYIAHIAYAMETVSARLPDELEEELEAFIEAEHLDRSTAVRKLLAEGLDEWKVEHALDRLEAGEVTFTRAAELADRNVWDFAQLVRDRDVVWIGEEEVDADLASF